MKSARRLAIAASIATLTFAITGCGNEDPDTTTSPSSTSPSSETAPTDTESTPVEASAEQTKACSSLLALQQTMATIGGDEPDKKTILTIQGLMVDIAAGTQGDPAISAQRAADTISEALDTKNLKLLDSDEFFGTLIAPASAGRECGFTPLDITIDEMAAATKKDNPMFHYMGLPAQVAPGTYSIGLTSSSKAFHEAIVIKLKDSYKGSKDDLLALPDAAMAKQFDGAPTVGYVPPDASGFVNADLTVPGRYLVFCHIPLEGEGGQLVIGDRGPIWHFVLGMAEEMTVS